MKLTRNGQNAQPENKPELTVHKGAGIEPHVKNLADDLLKVLRPADGIDGINGREVEIRNNGVRLEWRLQGADWKTLTELNAIKGEPGEDGKTPTIEVADTITAKPGTDAKVENLGDDFDVRLKFVIPKGEKGENGKNGAKGKDGEDGDQIELRKTANYIQWKYEGTTKWQNLIALNELQGAEGAAGAQGFPGAPGVPGTNGEGVAPGGTTGQVLAKQSNDDFDTHWVTGGGGGGGGTVESVVAGDRVTVDSTDPANPVVSADEQPATWGSITGDIGEQTDLVAELAAKAEITDTVASVVAGENINVDDTDPNNPVVSADMPSAYLLTGMFTNTDADVGGYKYAKPLTTYVEATEGSTSQTIGTEPTLIQSFTSMANNPGISLIVAGIATVHYDTQKDTGTDNYYTYAEIYKRSRAGVETLLFTTDQSTTTNHNERQSITVTAPNPNNITVNTRDRIVVKVYGVMETGSADVAVFYDGGSGSRLVYPTLISDSEAYVGWADVTDEDNMASDSDDKVPTQQSVKAYVDANAGGGVVESIVAGTNVTVDDTDPANPIVSATGGGGGGGAWGDITGTLSDQTDLQAELDSKQTQDDDLDDIAALTPSDDDFMQRKGGVWTNRTIAQVKTDVMGTLRVNTVASTATITPDGDNSDMYTVTALAVNAAVAAPSGTPINGQRLILRIKDNGTLRTLSWNAIYRAIGMILPNQTVATKTMYIGLIYNSADTKWDVISASTEL